MENKMKTYPSVAQSWGILGITILSMLIFIPINESLEGKLGNEPTTFIYYLLSMSAPLIFAFLLRKRITGIKSFNFSLPNFKVTIVTLIAMAAILLSISMPIVSSIPMPDSIKQLFLELGKQNGVFGFLTIVIAAPILEEIIFRGIILDGLLKRYSPTKSILLSSFLFGLVHLNPWQFISAMVIGSFSGWIYYRTKKLSLSILIHLINNLIGFIGMKSMPASEMMDTSISDFYGGKTQALFIISGGAVVAVICVFLLIKLFNRKNKVHSRSSKI
jgi:membrane protease YdiL (CAAX protease family)